MEKTEHTQLCINSKSEVLLTFLRLQAFAELLHGAQDFGNGAHITV